MSFWSAWWERIKELSDKWKGVYAVVAALTGAGFIAFLSGVDATLSQIVLYAGGSVTIILTVIMGYRTWPPPPLDPDVIYGQRHVWGDLKEKRHKMPIVGFVGPTRVGKSTLINHVTQIPSDNRVTETIEVVVFRPPGHFAPTLLILDPPGNYYAPQFEVVLHAQTVCVILDHNSLPTDTEVSMSRLQEHEKYLDQLRHYLVENRKQDIRIHFILGKRDLWETDKMVGKLQEWFADQVSNWTKSHPKGTVTSAIHTNKSPDCVTEFAQVMNRLHGIKS